MVPALAAPMIMKPGWREWSGRSALAPPGAAQIFSAPAVLEELEALHERALLGGEPAARAAIGAQLGARLGMLADGRGVVFHEHHHGQREHGNNVHQAEGKHAQHQGAAAPDTGQAILFSIMQFIGVAGGWTRGQIEQSFPADAGAHLEA